MAKTAAITIQLVPESKDIENLDIRKEIIKSLQCDWLLQVISVEITESKPQEKKELDATEMLS